MVTKIFYTGATGYIGGSVLDKLLHRSDASDFEITVLTRQAEKAKEFEKLGLKAIQGDLESSDLLREQCAAADIVMSNANADHEKSVDAMIEGMKKHKDQTGKTSVFIHVSGTGVIVVDAKGRAPKPEDPVYNDNDADQIETIPDDAPHRVVDLAIVAADKAGHLKSHIILPSTIYGISSAKKLLSSDSKEPLFNVHSDQMPKAVNMALDRGQPGHYGEGKCIWPHVHIEDLEELFMTVLDNAMTGKADHGREGFYFGINGHYEYRKASEAIGQAMKKRNVGKEYTPSPYEPELLSKYFPGLEWYVGSIGQGKAERAKKFGWKPKYTDDDFYAYLDEEVEAQIAKRK